ncbi:hypothetical protein K2173_018724 [Erythroxylum novogranatense]|uniref:Endonuclease/exonuclease/phosphatase n=1 Tax=Erythroxylum novogranatense TaxID=1862640 RepID=A0AAV8SAP5_9ROSI|nr:hypothetical protein K2173_018724 [Erythroxylum novogranatense]
MLSALVWNVRGIGNLASIRRLKKLCRIYAISCIILLEPFIEQQIGNASWMVGGDFNVIARLIECVGAAHPDLGSMVDFVEFLSQSVLQELSTAGGRFTWVGVRSRGLPSSFKFQNMWIRHPTFQSTVAASWEMPQEGYGMYRFSRKLRRLKEVLKHWNKDVFGNVFDRVRQAEATVKSLEQIFDSTQADVDLVNLKSSQANLFQALAAEEDFWRQKARAKWLQEGDRNTQFFHSSVLAKRSRLHISKLKNDQGDWMEDSHTLK